MNQLLFAVGMAFVLAALYNAVRVGTIFFRTIRRLAYNRDFVRLSERNPIGAFVILMQAPGKERGCIRYALTGLFFSVIGLFVLRKAVLP
jgi:hypothetical protein